MEKQLENPCIFASVKGTFCSRIYMKQIIRIQTQDRNNNRIDYDHENDGFIRQNQRERKRRQKKSASLFHFYENGTLNPPGCFVFFVFSNCSAERGLFANPDTQ